MKCQNCHTLNKYTNQYCQNCGAKLLNYSTVEASKKVKKYILMFFLIPFVFPIITFILNIGISTFLMYSESSKILENINETKGKLTSYVNCDYEYQLYKCNGVYTYNVDGKEYQIEGTKREDIESLEKEITVYYNFQNPSESSTVFTEDNTLTNIFLIVSIVSFSIIFIIVIVIYRLLKGPKNKKIKVDEIGNKPIKL